MDRTGDLYLMRPGAPDLVVRQPSPVDVALIGRLAAAPATLAELGTEMAVEREALESKLESLERAQALVVRHPPFAAPLPGDDAERFSRQLPYFAELGDEWDLQRRLRSATVAVIGCGGLGSWAIAAIASLGVGAMRLTDDDDIDLTNLNRQLLYRRSDVGSPKVDAAAAWLQAFDPGLDVTAIRERVTSEASAARAVEGAQAVVLAADWPPYRLARWVNSACVAGRTPFIVAGQLPPLVKVGPTYVPGAGACFECHEIALRRDSEAYDDYVAFRSAAPATASCLGPAAGLAGSLIGLEVMQVLLGRRPATQDVALILDMESLDVRRTRIGREPGCVACEHLPDEQEAGA